MASWFETRGVAALLTMRILDLILRSGVSRVSKDEATELNNALTSDSPGTIDVQFHFSDHVLDAGVRELTRGGQAIPVEPQVFDLLIYLVQNRDRVVSKDDLIERIWDGRIVSESTLTSRINAARKAVGDTGKHQALIRTIARKGF